MSILFVYIKSQYDLGNFNDTDLLRLVELNRITEEERIEIISPKS